MDWISLLMTKTGVFAKDCVIDNEKRLIFILARQDAGKVIGRGGETIRQLQNDFKRDISIIEYSDNLEQFAANTIAPVPVTRPTTVITTENQKSRVILTVDKKDRGRAIGKGAWILKRSQALLKRHFNIDDVKIATAAKKSKTKPKQKVEVVSETDINPETNIKTDPKLDSNSKAPELS